MNKTKEFEKLLAKVDKVEEITFDRIKHINTRGKKKQSDVPVLQYWNDLRSKHFVSFVNYKTRAMSDAMLGAKDFFKNGDFDKDLFNILRLKVGWSPGRNTLGTMSYGYKMNLRKKGDENANETVAHELGHAWHMQLPTYASLSERELQRETIINYLSMFYNNKFRSNASFNTLKPYIRDSISWYAGKSYAEAFAEIFSIGYTLGKKHKYRSIARKAIEGFNQRIKVGIYKKGMK